VVRAFDLVAAATGLRDSDAGAAGFDPFSVAAAADRKSYYPGASPIHARITGDRATGRLLGAQLAGRVDAQVAKRIDILATAISYGAAVADVASLDLSYTPPLGSPYDAVQHATQAWTDAVTPGQSVASQAG
jgi:NADPH-dependent 2,4-dienoyl-CoA reductase/sulfur reductase-like enzyme